MIVSYRGYYVEKNYTRPVENFEDSYAEFRIFLKKQMIKKEEQNYQDNCHWIMTLCYLCIPAKKSCVK